MIRTELSEDESTIIIRDNVNFLELDYDEAKRLNSALFQFINRNNTTNSLLPCRVCGNRPDYGGYPGHRTVKCRQCGVSMEAQFPHELVRKWNNYNRIL